MGNTEDYLDGLLNSLDENRHKDVETQGAFEESGGAVQNVSLGYSAQERAALQESMDADMKFIDSFEQEFLSKEDTDEFIRQFERELAEEEGRALAPDSENILLDNLDELLSGNQKRAGAFEEAAVLDDSLDDFMVDTMGDVSDAFGESFPEFSDEAAGEEASESLIKDDEQDMMDLLRSEGDFSGIGDIFSDDEKDADNLDAFGDGFGAETSLEASASMDAEAEGKKQKKEASGFLKKISQVLFGEEEELAEPAKARVSLPADIESLSEEDLLLMELEGGGTGTDTGAPAEEEQEEAEETPEEAKARKKREKAEKKAKKKAENAEKKAAKEAEKAAKKAAKQAKKDSKPKKPKEPDNTPPLPKKPVILCFVMVASFLVLVFLGTGLFGYSSSMTDAQTQYGQGDYEGAYHTVAGLDIKEEDYEIYEKYRIMGTIAGEYNSYQTFMEAGFYDMALDSLVRAVGRCGKYAQEAQTYGCSGELERVHTQAADALAGFGITEERALELYAMEEREDYSIQIHTVLEAAGYMAE